MQIVTFIEDNNLDNIWENLGSVSVMTKLKQYCIVKSKTGANYINVKARVHRVRDVKCDTVFFNVALEV